MTYNTQKMSAIILERIREEYATLLAANSVRFSLTKLLSPDSFLLDDYCNTYRPNKNIDSLMQEVKEYFVERDIWLDNSRHHISTVPFLFPLGQHNRMLSLTKNLTIDYQLNDWMGRDVFRWLSVEEQLTAREIITRIAAVDERLDIPPDATPVEVANIEILKEIKQSSPPEWFSRFLHLFNYHIAITHQDGNAADSDHTISVDEYIALRTHLGGMFHVVMWGEYSEGMFLNWDWLAEKKMDESIKKLHAMVAEFGVLSNDLFSFEKEVIDLGSNSNLVMALAFNHPDLSLSELFEQAAAIVRDRLMEFVATMKQLRGSCKELAAATPEICERVDHHLDVLDRCMQACWLWQKFTHRYKREHSIWQETSLSKATLGYQ